MTTQLVLLLSADERRSPATKTPRGDDAPIHAIGSEGEHETRSNASNDESGGDDTDENDNFEPDVEGNCFGEPGDEWNADVQTEHVGDGDYVEDEELIEEGYVGQHRWLYHHGFT